MRGTVISARSALDRTQEIVVQDIVIQIEGRSVNAGMQVPNDKLFRVDHSLAGLTRAQSEHEGEFVVSVEEEPSVYTAAELFLVADDSGLGGIS